MAELLDGRVFLCQVVAIRHGGMRVNLPARSPKNKLVDLHKEVLCNRPT